MVIHMHKNFFFKCRDRKKEFFLKDFINFINFKNTFQYFEQKVGKFYFIYLQFQTKNN